MNEGPRYVNFSDYVRVVRERRLLVVLITLLFAGAALGWSIRQEPTYEAETSLQFKDVNLDTSIVGTVSFDTQTAEQRAAIAAEGIARPEVIERAQEILRTDVSEGELASSIAARPETRTHLVVITARSSDPKFAARLANAVGQAAREVSTRDIRQRYLDAADAQRRVVKRLGRAERFALTRTLIESQITQLEQVARFVEPVDIRREAVPPGAPVAPRPIRNTLLGLLLGLTMGLLAAFLRDSLDRRFKNSREITAELHLPLLGHVREEVLGRTVIADGREALTAPELESFRILHTNVEFLSVDAPPKQILVTSAMPEEGKSTVAAALAFACASAGKRTLLVECDLRRPTMAKRLGLADAPGLSDYLIGHAEPRDILQTVAIPTVPGLNGSGAQPSSLVCITAGAPTPQPAELLRSKRFQSFFEQVRDVYDAVIVDTTPLLPVVDTLELLPRADAVVMCVRASVTSRDQARAAKAAIDHFPERPAGVVITGLRGSDEYAYGYYSYGYAYEPSR